MKNQIAQMMHANAYVQKHAEAQAAFDAASLISQSTRLLADINATFAAYDRLAKASREMAAAR